MTHFEIALKFSGLRAVDLAHILGAGTQQVNGWLRGERVPSRTTVKTIATALNVTPAWLLGVPDAVTVRDPISEQVVEGRILRVEQIAGYGTLYHVHIDESGDVVPVLFAGEQFTPRDWQTLTVRSAQDIAGERWMDHRGRDAVMLDGLPRMIE